MLKIYHAQGARSLRVLWLLNELDVDCEIVTVDMGAGEHQGDAFRKLNPAGKLPALVDGDVVLTESSAIQLYLAEKYPQRGFIPNALAERAEMYRWIFFLVTEIEAPLWRIALHSRIYPDNERDAREIPRPPARGSGT